MSKPHYWRPVFGLLIAWTLIGSNVEAAEPIALRAGPLTMLFDAENAFLRYVKFGEHEILRGVNAPIRDQNWGTVRPKVSNVKLDKHDDHFTLTFDAACQEADIDFRWHGKITGTKAGEVEFTFDGQAHTAFLRNRIGMCILHPAAAAGKPWVIHHVNGEQSKGQFPTNISPNQPAKEIRGISHEVADKIWAHVEMEGEVFEMEDQRNWTDASFKTYCIPLERPYPVQVEKGTKIVHKVRIRVDGANASAGHASSQADEQPVVLTLTKRETKLPPIGLQVSSETNELSARQVSMLKELRLNHLRVDLQLTGESWRKNLQATNKQARTLDVPLHVGIRLGERPNAEMQSLVAALKDESPNVAAYIIHVTDWKQFEPARKALEPIRGKAQIGADRGANFVDLNRDRPQVDNLDLVAFAINPQIHAFDNASIAETLPIHAQAVESARQFVGKRSLAVGPITLKPAVLIPPSSPAADSSEKLPADVDARQTSKFAAAWTLGSLNDLAAAGADNITYFETIGWKGIIDLDRGAKRPAAFPAATGEAFPIYHVLREAANFTGATTQSLENTDPLRVVGLALNRRGESRLLVANLTERPQTVVIKGLTSPAAVSSVLTDADGDEPKPSVSAGESDPAELSVTLPPLAIARLKSTSRD